MAPLLAEAYLHNIDPVLIPITESFAVRWYGLAYAAGFIIAWLIYRWFAVTGRSPLKADRVGDLMFYGILGVLLGGRLGYALFYDPTLFVRFSDSLPYWDLLAINKGGMASHGGMLGVLVAVWLFSRRQAVPALHVMDIGAVACAPGLFLGRIANFVNGELIGKPITNQDNPPWWSIKFPQEMRSWSVEQLRELREIVPHVRVGTAEWDHALMQLAAQPKPPRESLQLVRNTTEHLIQAVQAGNVEVTEQLRPILTAFYPSQILQAISDGPVLLAVLALVWLRPRKPGVIGGTFLVTYGILRIITELFRQPDAALMLGLSRGQLLSVVMVLCGAAMIHHCARREVKPMGGLRAPAAG